MVMGFLRDGRIEEQRKRAEAERERADSAIARAAAEAVIERERQRADAADARVDRVLERYEAMMAELIRRLPESNGEAPKPPPAASE